MSNEDDIGVYGSPTNYTFATLNWRETGTYLVAYRLAIEDLNANPDILPNTFLDFEEQHHDLNPAVRNIFV